MTRRQFASFLGVVLVWIAWETGWVVFAAIAAALVGWAVVYLLDRGVDPRDWNDRLRRDHAREPRAGARL